MKETGKEMGKEVERYLNRATQGLWGRKRQEVREELEAHISERVMTHRIAGLDEEDAVERTLIEMGEPKEVSAGMTQIYTVPWVAGSGVFFAAVCAVCVVALSSGVAQTLQITQTFPSPFCLEETPDVNCQPSGPWTTFEALQEVLEPQGVEVSKVGETVSLRFSDGKAIFTTLQTPSFFAEDSEKFAEQYQPKSGYFLVWDVLESLVGGYRIPVRVEGWNNPTVHFGNTSFTIGSDEQPVDGKGFYLEYLASLTFNPNQLFAHAYQKPSLIRIPRDDSVPLTLQVGTDNFNAIYGVVAVEPFSKQDRSDAESDLTLSVDVAQIEADGKVSLRLPSTDATFLNRFSGEPQQDTAVLVRLTGESTVGRLGFGYEVIPPEQISVVEE